MTELVWQTIIKLIDVVVCCTMTELSWQTVNKLIDVAITYAAP
jgi:hypothetical protein